MFMESLSGLENFRNLQDFGSLFGDLRKRMMTKAYLRGGDV
jgi:hypothetical protein